MLGYYFARLHHRDLRRALELESLTRAADVPPITYSHNGSSFADKLPPHSKVVASPLEWRGKQVLLLVRDCRDILVSSYFHSRYREQAFDSSISQFIRHPFLGAEKVLTALNRWNDQRHLASSFQILSYEEISLDPFSSLTESLSFAGVKNPDSSIVEEAVKFTEFNHLQKLEGSGYFDNAEMRKLSGDERGRKIRNGKIGGFREHLSDEDIFFIDEMERKMGNPFRSAVKTERQLKLKSSLR
jgi:alcohol sulfotransferase